LRKKHHLHHHHRCHQHLHPFPILVVIPRPSCGFVQVFIHPYVYHSYYHGDIDCLHVWVVCLVLGIWRNPSNIMMWSRPHKNCPWDKRGNHSWLEGVAMVLSDMLHRIFILSSQGGVWGDSQHLSRTTG
jgi:hypothetical protein